MRHARMTAAALLVLAALLAAAAPRASAAEAPEWEVYRSNVKAIPIGNGASTVGKALGAFLDYEFDLPLEFMRRAQSYTGPSTRLRRVVASMLAGRKVEVAILGGSVSAGAVASRKMDPTDPNDVWNLVRLALQKGVSPKIEFYNNARAATKSYITSLCVDKFLNATADLVFVEFIANDGSEMDTQIFGPQEKTRSFERFLRKIQGQPSNPAVVMMQMLVSEMALPPGGRDGKPKRGFWSTPEDNYGNLAQYYDIPTLSFRDALWQLGDNGRDGMSWDDFMGSDRLHPNDRGHRLMSDMVVYLLQQTAVDLLVHPLSAADVAASRAPMPPPMFDANEAGREQVCAQGKEMKDYVASSDGWSLVEYDGPGMKYPTYGYETTQTGKPLVLQVDTTTPGGPAGAAAGVVLTYTKAQTGFGNAKITCANGCTCDPVTLDGAVEYDQIVVFLEELHPSAAPTCQVRVEMDSSSPSGSKLRISGVAITADPGHVSGRIGEEKYMSWLTGENWAA
ncbi:MAG: SGNH hydrolase-type esterase domain-containing protein [Monoraphidium minutum]|nr:MAG: SGNH hydrolase-type esterase domain-containing protein [Monoraphidium minutum]